MGEHNMGDIKDYNKEINKKLAEEIDSISIEEAEAELEKEQKILEISEYSLRIKKEDLNGMKTNSAVRRYIMLESMVLSLEEESEKTKEKLTLLRQRICNHEFVYMTSYCPSMIDYSPIYRCLDCGKQITGIYDGQTCINEEYLEKKGNSFCGNVGEYSDLSIKFSELKEDGASYDDIVSELYNELHKRNNGKKIRYSTLKLTNKNNKKEA